MAHFGTDGIAFMQAADFVTDVIDDLLPVGVGNTRLGGH